jgi:DNA-binding transcriptional regulator YiaG
MDMLTPAQIRELRKSLGLTLKELGAYVGVTEACVCQWENAKSHPTFKKMEKLNDIRANPERYRKHSDPEPQPA